MRRFKDFRAIVLILLSALIFSSCEEVIELDFKDADPKLVIEGIVTDEPGPYTVKLTESAAFYDSNVFPPRTGASVTISDDIGNENLLTETAPGVYETTDLQGVLGRTYTVRIETEGETYIASSRIPDTEVPIDFLEIGYEEESIFLDEGLYATAYATDPGGVENFYRFSIFVNGAPYITFPEGSTDPADGEEDRNFYLASDKFFDGIQIDIQFDHLLEIGDTVDVELHQLDESTFDYYRTFVDAVNGVGVAPANPVTNFGDRALGYFGAFSIRKAQIVVE